MKLIGLATGLIVSSLTFGAASADFYVDPAAGSASGDGSAQKPWKTLEEVVTAKLFGTSIKAGDTVHLKAGYHGEMAVSGGSFSPPITVVGDPGLVAKLRHVRFTSTSGWILDGVSVSPSYGSSSAPVTMIEVQTSSSKITVQNSAAFSVTDASGWGAPEWLAASSGISLRGAESVARNNALKNVRFGITADASKCVVEGNVIENFSADGLRGLGDDEVFQYNVVKNSYLDDSLDPNHDDGFQSWSVGTGGVGTGEVKNMVLRGNVIINSVSASQPLKGTLQGIGCFDGMFTGWVVENNVVITNHWHGISLYGAKDSRIVNNTVIDNDSAKPGPPWIMVNNHKNGTPSSNVIVRNNLSMDYDVKGTNVVEDYNTTLVPGDFASYFVNAAAGDVRLLQNAPAVDKGSADQAPALDADKIPRPQGSAVDLGAYEWHDGTVVPTDAGVGGGTGTGGTAASGGNAGTSAGGGTAGGGTGGASGNAGTGGKAKSDSGDDGGCGCRTAGDRSTASTPWWLLAAFALLVGRRRAS